MGGTFLFNPIGNFLDWLVRLDGYMPVISEARDFLDEDSVEDPGYFE